MLLIRFVPSKFVKNINADKMEIFSSNTIAFIIYISPTEKLPLRVYIFFDDAQVSNNYSKTNNKVNYSINSHKGKVRIKKY